MTTPSDSLLRQLAEAERDLSHPTVRPRDAATLILVDRSSHPPKVLLGRRHHSHKFMPGKYVFPGGRVDPLDRRLAASAHLDPRVERRLMQKAQRPSAVGARALVMAAIRETFEETGLLLNFPKTIDAPTTATADSWATLAHNGARPDLTAIHFIARAITPPGRSRRFDTRFFTADATAVTHRIDGVVGPDTELVELVWVPLTEAKRVDMPPITMIALEELEARVAAGLTHDLPVPFYRVVRRRFSRELL